MRGVVLAWIAAAAVAVLAAAVAGYGISSRIARPIVALEQATERMAEGDLTSRADASGDGEIGRLAGSYNRMADQVEQTVSALRRFVSDAAHQIGTPLTALRADLELARDAGVTDDERGRLVARALGHERRLEDLGAKLLQLSRLESGERESHPEVLDLTELAREAADTYASRAEQAGVLLELDGNAPVRAIADPARLRTAVENLLDNAVKFTPDGGTVVVRSRVDGGLACLEVIDTGRGIPTEDRTRVFERFHRARNAADTPGSGLGLAIAQAAVEGSDGKVALESGPEGTTARLSLRLAATA